MSANRPAGLLKCEQVSGLLTDYLSRELGDAQSVAIREHLRKCPECTAKADELDQTVELLKSLTEDTIDAPKRLSEHSRDRIRRRARHPFLAWADRWQVMIYLMILGLLFTFLMMFFAVPPAPPLEGDLVEIEMPFNPNHSITNSLEVEHQKRTRGTQRTILWSVIFVTVIASGAALKARRSRYRARMNSSAPRRDPPT